MPAHRPPRLLVQLPRLLDGRDFDAFAACGFALSVQEKGTDSCISHSSRPALLPIFDPPSNNCFHFVNEASGSCQLSSSQRFADHSHSPTGIALRTNSL